MDTAALIVAIVAAVGAVGASVFAGMSWHRAGKANDTADAANRIAREQRDAATANNSIAEGANRLATEALQVSRNEQERMQRRDEEFHEVAWSLSWALDPMFNEPKDVVSLTLGATNLGPDHAFDVEMLFYQNDFMICRNSAVELAAPHGIFVMPVDPREIEKAHLEGKYFDDHGNEVPPPPFERDAVESAAHALFHANVVVKLRWRSAAGAPYKRTFIFLPLRDHGVYVEDLKLNASVPFEVLG